ncbi:MAG: signal transduction histidine kinase [Cognaticolwellia sp.]|jgi:signal transduction histidine kinase
MITAPLPSDEAGRIKELKYFQILDTVPEAAFDDFTKIASYICQTPIALITLVDESRQWFKSKVGLDATETSRDMAFCSHAILQDDVFVIPDSLKDERFYDNPLATQAPDIRFYAGAPLTTSSGHKIGTLCVIDDHPRNIDLKQTKILQALARQVVNQLELRLAKKVASELAKTKASFLATMSHEIRTPLNGILGCANILLDTVKDKEHIKLTETITQCGHSLLKLVNDILDFAKIESGKIELENEAFNLHQFLAEIVHLFSHEAKRKSLSLTVEYGKNVPDWIFGDFTRLRQILSNLISNAIKFTEKGFVTIEINESPEHSTESAAGKEVGLTFSVKDSGIGINTAAQSKLFTSFSQADSSIEKKFGGTGLGLAISKALVELMKGRIWLNSTEGVGSTFNFTILTKPVTKKNKTRVKKVTFNKTMANEHPLKILLAEDNRVNQFVAKNTIQKIGYKIDIASNGIEALEMLKNYPYDVVLMDCMMPEMDGLEATALIKKSPDLYGTPKVIALTASALKEDKEKCAEVGMDDFLSKPLDMNEIIRVLTMV